jgi:hypothetical protein
MARPESFEAFFAASKGQVQPMFEAAGPQSEPHPEFWQVLDTADEVGWDA